MRREGDIIPTKNSEQAALAILQCRNTDKLDPIPASVDHFNNNKSMYLMMRTVSLTLKTIHQQSESNDHAASNINANKNLTDLPAEIIWHILSFLPFFKLKFFASTNKHFWYLVQDNKLWSNLLDANGYHSTLITLLRENGFCNSDIYNCFPLLRNKSYRPQLSAALVTLIAWGTYLIPADIINAMQESDLEQIDQTYINNIAAILPELEFHCLISTMITTGDYRSLIPLIKLIPTQYRYSSLRVAILKGLEHSLNNDLLDTIAIEFLRVFLERVAQFVQIIEEKSTSNNIELKLRLLIDTKLHQVLPRIASLLLQTNALGVSHNSLFDTVLSYIERNLLTPNCDLPLLIDSILQISKRNPPEQSKLFLNELSGCWDVLFREDIATELSVNLLHKLEDSNFEKCVTFVIYLSHIFHGNFNRHFWDDHIEQKINIINFFNYYDIDKAIHLLYELHGSLIGQSILDIFLDPKMSMHDEDTIDDVILLAKMLARVDRELDQIYRGNNLYATESHAIGNTLKILLCKYSTKIIGQFLEILTRKLGMAPIKISLEKLLSSDDGTLSIFLSECEHFPDDAIFIPLLRCGLKISCTHGMDSANIFIRMIRELFSLRNPSTNGIIAPKHCIQQYNHMLDLLFHSCIKSAELHGFAGIDDFYEILSKFKTTDGNLDSNISMRLIRELSIYIVAYGCKEIKTDFELIQRNCIDELQQNKSNFFLNKNNNNSLDQHGLFAKQSSQLKNEAKSPDPQASLLKAHQIAQMQHHLNKLIAILQIQLGHEYRISIENASNSRLSLFRKSGSYIDATAAQMEYLFLTQLQQLLFSQREPTQTIEEAIEKNIEKAGLITNTIFSNFDVQKVSPQIAKFITSIRELDYRHEIVHRPNAQIVRRQQ